MTRTAPPARLRRRDWLRAAGLGAAAAWGTAWAVPAAAASDAAVRVDWPSLALLDGSRLEPRDFHDTAVVLVFWATWCGYCTRHNGHVEQLHRRMAGRPLRVLGACIDGDDPARVAGHVRRHGWTFPVTLQADVLRRQFPARRMVPLTVAIDRRGLARTPIPGEMAEADVLELAALARAG